MTLLCDTEKTKPELVVLISPADPEEGKAARAALDASQSVTNARAQATIFGSFLTSHK